MKPSVRVTYGRDVLKFSIFLFVWAVFNFPHPCTSTPGFFSYISELFSGDTRSAIPLDASCFAQAPAGSFQGYARPTVLDPSTTFCSFVGIQYGETTGGDNRFAEPIPAKPLKGINLALVDGPLCAQCIKGIPVGGENCLYLNVYTPNPITVAPGQVVDASELKAVLVYIHGGGWILGSGSSFLFAPDPLMGHDVIVVTMNYRLEALGFVTLGIPGCSGNQGLRDQNLALRWVHDNIKSFGGDPNRVTLMGESAGGWSVHLQSLSPQSQIPAPLFDKVIIQSAISPHFILKNMTEYYSVEFVKYLGYKGDTNDRQGMLKYLKGLSTLDMQLGYDSFCDHLEQTDPAFLFLLTPFYGTIDDYLGDKAFLPDSEENLGAKAAPVSVIAGQTDADGTCYFLPWHAADVTNNVADTNSLKAQIDALLPNTNSTAGINFESLGIGKSSEQNSFGQLINKLVDLPSLIAHVATSYDVNSTLNEIVDNLPVFLDPKYTKDPAIQNQVVQKLMDYYFGPNTGNRLNQGVKLTTDLRYYRFYDQMSGLFKASYNNNKIYNYQYCYTDTIYRFFMLGEMGAVALTEVEGVGHADDIAFTSFYPPPFYPVFLPSAQDRQFIHDMTTLFTTFVKTGNPNSDDDSIEDEWKPITPQQNSYLRLDKESHYFKGRINEDRREMWDSLPHS